MDGEPILKKTLVTVAAMISAWAAFMGTVSLVAVLVTSRAVGSGSPDGANASSPSESSSTKSDVAPGAHHAPNGRSHQSI